MLWYRSLPCFFEVAVCAGVLGLAINEKKLPVLERELCPVTGVPNLSWGEGRTPLSLLVDSPVGVGVEWEPDTGVVRE